MHHAKAMFNVVTCPKAINLPRGEVKALAFQVEIPIAVKLLSRKIAGIYNNRQ